MTYGKRRRSSFIRATSLHIFALLTRVIHQHLPLAPEKQHPKPPIPNELYQNMEDDLFQELKEKVQERTWWSRSPKPFSNESSDPS
jgi:hypothetical protein